MSPKQRIYLPFAPCACSLLAFVQPSSRLVFPSLVEIQLHPLGNARSLCSRSMHGLPPWFSTRGALFLHQQYNVEPQDIPACLGDEINHE
jgi:hypothetical protein